MSSGNLEQSDNRHFTWHGSETTEDYVFATYDITTPVDGDQAAFGMAREQSVCATSLSAIRMPGDIKDYCARVVEVEELSGAVVEFAPLYFLNTPVYSTSQSSGRLRRFKTVIAYPVLLFGNSLTRLWNSVFGEIHRLGYLSAVALVDLKLSPSLAATLPGPKYGVSGLRQKLAIPDRPIFCRSMRPASGLDTDSMLKLNALVLSGGFDVIKDDELTYDSRLSPFGDRLRRMLDMKRRIEDKTGERKLYFPNIIDDLSAALTMAEEAAELGADGVLVSASAQGFSFISEVARRTGLIVLSHNSCGDVITRASSWGASDAVMARLQRAAGADLVVSPGPFATPFQDTETGQAFLRACREPLGTWGASMPVVQGGKQPTQLAQYIEDVGSTDFMIIAATWLDNHAEGMQAGARAFRDAWEIVAGATEYPNDNTKTEKDDWLDRV